MLISEFDQGYQATIINDGYLHQRSCGFAIGPRAEFVQRSDLLPLLECFLGNLIINRVNVVSWK